MAIIGLGNAHDDKFLPYPCYAGGAVEAGDIVVRAADDGYFDAVVADAVLVSGIAQNKAAAEGDPLYIKPILPGKLYEIPYTNSFATTDIGQYIGLSGPQTADADEATAELMILHSYDATTSKCIVSFIPTLVTGFGVER